MGSVRWFGRERPSFAAFCALLAASLLAGPSAQAVLDDAARAEILHQRGAHALRTGDTEKAMQQLYESLQLLPDRKETLALYARALLEAGHPELAEQVTQRLREIEPDDADVTFLLGVTAYRQQDWIAAKKHLEEARSQRPGDPKIHLYLGRAYQELGEDTNAEAALREAASIDPEYATAANYRLAILHLQRNEVPQAKTLFKQVKAADPESELGKSADLYLRLIAESQPRRISYWGKLGLAWDSNVTLAGDDDLVAQSEESGIRGTLEVGLNSLVMQREVFDRRLTLRTGFNGYMSYHDDFQAFDISQIRPWTLTSYQIHPMLAVDARLSYEQVWRHFHHFKWAYVAQPALRFTPKPGWLTRAFWEYEKREYTDAFELVPTRDRDGAVRRAGIDQYIPIPNPVAEGPAYVRFGYRYRDETAHGLHFDSGSHKPMFTLGLALPWNMNLTLDASYEHREFEEISLFDGLRDIRAKTGSTPPLSQQRIGCQFQGVDRANKIFTFFEDLSNCPSDERLDQIIQTRLRVRKNIGKSWTIESSYRFVRWKSNTPEFDFERHIVGLAATFRR